MNLDHLLVAAAVGFAVVFSLFWLIGLFDDRPIGSRIACVGAATTGYVGLQLLAAAVGTFGLAAVGAATDTLVGTFNVWSLVLFGASTTAAVRLVTFRRGPSRHRVAYAWLSWFLVVGLVATAVKIAFGVKPPPGPVESLAVAAFAWRLLVHRGNLSHLLRSVVATCRRIVTGRPA